MSTYQSGNVRKATANTVTSQRVRAEASRCPQCGRKGATRYDVDLHVRYCRFCDWSVDRN